MEVNQEKRAKFMENAGKRVNKVMHDIEILEPMSRSNVYDFTKEDVEEMFSAMQNALDTAKAEYNKKFEGRAKTERKLFSFGTGVNTNPVPTVNLNANTNILAENNPANEVTTNQELNETQNVLPTNELETMVEEALEI